MKRCKNKSLLLETRLLSHAVDDQIEPLDSVDELLNGLEIEAELLRDRQFRLYLLDNLDKLIVFAVDRLLHLVIVADEVLDVLGELRHVQLLVARVEAHHALHLLHERLPGVQEEVPGFGDHLQLRVVVSKVFLQESVYLIVNLLLFRLELRDNDLEVVVGAVEHGLAAVPQLANLLVQAPLHGVELLEPVADGFQGLVELVLHDVEGLRELLDDVAAVHLVNQAVDTDQLLAGGAEAVNVRFRVDAAHDGLEIGGIWDARVGASELVVVELLIATCAEVAVALEAKHGRGVAFA